MKTSMNALPLAIGLLFAFSLLLPAALAASEPPKPAKRITAYTHECGGLVDIQCCTQMSPNPEDGCDPARECILYSPPTSCVGRPLPTGPWNPLRQCGGGSTDLQLQCNHCTKWDYSTEPKTCLEYEECAAWVDPGFTTTVGRLSPCIQRP